MDLDFYLLLSGDAMPMVNPLTGLPRYDPEEFCAEFEVLWARWLATRLGPPLDEDYERLYALTVYCPHRVSRQRCVEGCARPLPTKYLGN